MSWNFSNAGGWEISGLSINSSELTIAVWAKNQSGAGDEAGVLLSDSTDDLPRALLTVQNDRFGCMGIWTKTGGDVAALQSNSADGSQSQWHLVLISISATGPTATSRVDGGTAATATPSGAWPGAAMDRLRWGVDLTGTGFYTNRMSHLAIWNKALSAAERDDLWNGGTGGIGKNPRDVASANLIHYSEGNTTTPIVGSGTWSAVGTTPTWDAADNPSVDAPTGGGGGGILLTQVERGRAMGRGILRGV